MAEFYFDECLLGAAKLLINDGFEVLHPGHVGLPGLDLGARDTEWMPRVAAEGLIAVTRDRRINRKRGDGELVGAEGLKLHRLAGRNCPRRPSPHTPPAAPRPRLRWLGRARPGSSASGASTAVRPDDGYSELRSLGLVMDAPVAGAQWHPSACPFASCRTRWA